MKLIKCDPETGEPVRNEKGLCVLCSAGECGEFVAKIVREPGGATNYRFFALLNIFFFRLFFRQSGKKNVFFFSFFYYYETFGGGLDFIIIIIKYIYVVVIQLKLKLQKKLFVESEDLMINGFAVVTC